jgi:hypothetical protein
VLDVQPDDVVGDVMAVEAGVHLAHVRLVAVVPAALVVAERKVLRQRAGACELRVLLRDLRRTEATLDPGF